MCNSRTQLAVRTTFVFFVVGQHDLWLVLLKEGCVSSAISCDDHELRADGVRQGLMRFMYINSTSFSRRRSDSNVGERTLRCVKPVWCVTVVM